MANRVLVTYATRHGSTAEVAEEIANVLRHAQLPAEVRAVDELDTVDPYDAVVFGAPLYMGRLQRAGARFLAEHHDELAQLPLAVFALGPNNTEDSRRGAQRQLDRKLATRPDLHPFAVGLFGGVIDPDKLRFPFTRLNRGDWRDWDAIRLWARSLVPQLQLATALSSTRSPA
ncbi:MAG: flavodoxin domain-containing protein [Solirubrobacterales bacterium]|nr:flavodoxin domain-containing protein [Solirubrobacterales bacterium]